MSPAAVEHARGARLLLAGAVVVHLAVLYLPDPPSLGGVGALPFADTVTHVAAFALVAWAGRVAAAPPRLLLGLLVAHALVSELLQHTLLPGRTGDVADVLADLVGIAVGLVLPVPAGERA